MKCKLFGMVDLDLWTLVGWLFLGDEIMCFLLSSFSDWGERIVLQSSWAALHLASRSEAPGAPRTPSMCRPGLPPGPWEPASPLFFLSHLCRTRRSSTATRARLSSSASTEKPLTPSSLSPCRLRRKLPQPHDGRRNTPSCACSRHIVCPGALPSRSSTRWRY